MNDDINYYERYNKDFLEAISELITKLFNNNHLTLDDDYEKMKIKIRPNEYKDIYLTDCDSNMEKFTIELFLDRTGKLSIP